MQIINRIDLVFTAVYSGLILVVGTVFVIASGNIVFIPVTLLAEAVYLYFAFNHPYRRLKAAKQAIPADWKNILARCSSFYLNLDQEAKERFERDVRIFLGDFSIEGLRRKPVDLKIKLLVASGFAALLHGRPQWEPPIKDGVLVYPGDRFSKDYEVGKGIRAGQASFNSPLIVTEGSLEHSFRNPDDGYNVIYHELAHYFDLEDGIANGIPTAKIPPEKLEDWRTLIHEEWKKAGAGRSFLGTYAGTNEAETFAVAVEFFFENPGIMYRHNPELYHALKDFFNIDTLAIMKS